MVGGRVLLSQYMTSPDAPLSHKRDQRIEAVYWKVDLMLEDARTTEAKEKIRTILRLLDELDANNELYD